MQIAFSEVILVIKIKNTSILNNFVLLLHHCFILFRNRVDFSKKYELKWNGNESKTNFV